LCLHTISSCFFNERADEEDEEREDKQEQICLRISLSINEEEDDGSDSKRVMNGDKKVSIMEVLIRSFLVCDKLHNNETHERIISLFWEWIQDDNTFINLEKRDDDVGDEGVDEEVEVGVEERRNCLFLYEDDKEERVDKDCLTVAVSSLIIIDNNDE